MTNKERLVALISVLENSDPNDRTQIIEETVGSLKEIFCTLRGYRKKYRDIFATFCDNTENAIECLYQESLCQGYPGHPALWDLFARPDVIADLSKYLGCESQPPAVVFDLVIDKNKQSIGKAAKTLRALADDKNRNGVDCTEYQWKKTIRRFLRKQGHADMIKHFYWDKQKLHTDLPVGKFFVTILPKS